MNPFFSFHLYETPLTFLLWAEQYMGIMRSFLFEIGCWSDRPPFVFASSYKQVPQSFRCNGSVLVNKEQASGAEELSGNWCSPLITNGRLSRRKPFALRLVGLWHTRSAQVLLKCDSVWRRLFTKQASQSPIRGGMAVTAICVLPVIFNVNAFEVFLRVDVLFAYLPPPTNYLGVQKVSMRFLAWFISCMGHTHNFPLTLIKCLQWIGPSRPTSHLGSVSRLAAHQWWSVLCSLATSTTEATIAAS